MICYPKEQIDLTLPNCDDYAALGYKVLSILIFSTRCCQHWSFQNHEHQNTECCQCVDFSECSTEGNILDGGEGLTDPLIHFPPGNGNDPLLKACPEESQVSQGQGRPSILIWPCYGYSRGIFSRRPNPGVLSRKVLKTKSGLSAVEPCCCCQASIIIRINVNTWSELLTKDLHSQITAESATESCGNQSSGYCAS